VSADFGGAGFGANPAGDVLAASLQLQGEWKPNVTAADEENGAGHSSYFAFNITTKTLSSVFSPSLRRAINLLSERSQVGLPLLLVTWFQA
jgi:hypothetical protein